MRRAVLACVALVSLSCLGSVQAQETAAPLEGRWLVVDGEHNAKPMKTLNGGVMTVTGTAFEIRTASGNTLKGVLKLDASKKPAHMDMVHADGTVWEAIYEVTGDTLRLNYVQRGLQDPRPTTFKTSATTEESLIVLQRDKR